MKKYFYKTSKVKGSSYLQIWSRKDGCDKFVRTVGNAENLNQKLVKLKKYEEADSD